MDLIVTLKAASIACSLGGTGLLAWRVTKILGALKFTAECHEANIAQLASGGRAIFQLTNSTNHIKNAHNTGTKLLILGFSLYGASAILNAGVFYIEHLQK